MYFSNFSSRSSFIIRFLLLGAAALLVASQFTASPTQLAAPMIATSSLSTARDSHTATLLPNGKLLVAGGRNTRSGDASGALRSVEIYDPATGKWSDAAPLNVARFDHVAVLLRDGTVLAAGGRNAGGVLDSNEIYDPVTAKWTINDNKLNVARAKATATLLPLSQLPASGTVLLAGGENAGGVVKEAELYDPAAKKWTLTGSLTKARSEHTATLLPNGRVLVIGGSDSSLNSLKSAETFDPRLGSWNDVRATMNVARRQHTATLLGDGGVLVAGGFDGAVALNSSEAFSPLKQLWMPISAAMNEKRRGHTATLLQNGQVFVVGGFDGSAALKTSETFTPANKTWTKSVSFNDGRYNHTATMMPNGRVLLAAGNPNSTVPLASTELHDPAQGSWTYTQSASNITTVMSVARANHTATLLTNGKVLVAGGSDFFTTHKSSELFDPATGQWQVTGDLRTERQGHTATLLPDGRVLVAGGQLNDGTVLSSAEIYDPATGAWNFTDNLTQARFNHTATLLPSGRVLVLGGSSAESATFPEFGATALVTAESYDPATNQWTRLTASMKAARQLHTATLLPNGNVLIAGGLATANSAAAINTAETYTPSTGSFDLTGNMNFPRLNHTASLLPSGKVLVMGGPRGPAFTAANYAGSAETYDPATGTWTKTSADPPFRRRHSANVLPNGKVLIAGGFRYVAASGNTPAASPSTNETLLYDPETDSFEGPATTAKLNSSRGWQAATILPGGRVLATGGTYYVGTTLIAVFSSAEIYDVGLNVVAKARPSINAASWGGAGKAVCVGGVQFQGVSEGDSADTQNSPANYPVVQMMRLDNEQIIYLSPDPNATACAGGAKGWTNNTYASFPVTAGNFAGGSVLLTVFTNGIPSGKSFTLAPNAAAATPNTPLNINISGRVSDINGAGFPATLTIRGSDGSVRVIQNGANGEYSFPDLPSALPAQNLASLTPSAANAGGTGLTLVVNGSGFTDRSVVLWNGSPRQTQFTNSTRLTAILSANDLGTHGIVAVTVFTAGFGTTNALTFKLNAVAPAITAIDPSTAIEGSPGLTLTVTGQNFVQGSAVLWNGSQRATTFINATQLRAAITAADLRTAGRATVQVLNPSATAAIISNALFFSIAPSCTTSNPPSCLLGDLISLQSEPSFHAAQQSAEVAAAANNLLFSPEQGSTTYTVTPSATASNGQPVSFEPSSAGGITSTNNNANFLAKGAGLVIAGTVSGLSGNMANVTLTLLSDPSVMPVVVATNGAGNYTFSECYLNGDYRIVAANVNYSINPANREILGLDDAFLSENFLATSTVVCPTVSNIAPANGIIGSMVTINGANFTSDIAVKFNSTVTASPVNVNGAGTQITVAVPPGAVTGAITLSKTGCSDVATSTFTVVAGYESDVAPRGATDGMVNMGDWTQVGRFIAAFDTTSNGAEFQSADCAPRATLGDGRLTVADWVQAGRYAAALDPIVPLGGPTSSSFAGGQLLVVGQREKSNNASQRQLRLLSNATSAWGIKTISALLDASGDENAVSFSLQFDPSKWRLLGIEREPDAAQALLQINNTQQNNGRLGLALLLSPGQAWNAGERRLAAIRFVAIDSTANNDAMNLSLGDQPMAREMVDLNANALNATFELDGAEAAVVVSAADFAAGTLARESIATTFGQAFSLNTETAETLPLPLQLAGTQITVRDSAGIEHAALLFFVSPMQINFQIPASAATGLATVTIRNQFGRTSQSAIEIVETAPSLFSADARGQGFASGVLMRVKGDNVSYEPLTKYDHTQNAHRAIPIQFGSEDEQLFLILFGTGLRHHNGAVTARLGNTDLPVLYAGAQGEMAGLDQINLAIPRTLGGSGEIELRVITDEKAANPLRVLFK
jgi:uncharacterized protein (TIGR03437 family)